MRWAQDWFVWKQKASDFGFIEMNNGSYIMFTYTQTHFRFALLVLRSIGIAGKGIWFARKRIATTEMVFMRAEAHAHTLTHG